MSDELQPLDLKAYSVEVEHTIGIRKTPGIYGHYSPNIIAPLVYLKKPRWVSDEDFKVIRKAIRLELPIKEETK